VGDSENETIEEFQRLYWII